MNNKIRKTNIEFLRIICMIMIIAHHFVLHGGLVNEVTSPNWNIALGFYPGGKICFDTFLMISFWFLCQQKYRFERFARLYLCTMFYSVAVAMISFYYFGVEHSIRDVIGVFFPITGNVHGFAAAYLIVYSFIPFYSKICEVISKKQLLFIILLLAFTQILSVWMFDLVDHTQKITSNVAFFSWFYFLAYYIRKYEVKIVNNTWAMLAIFVIGWITMSFLFAKTKLYPQNVFYKYLLEVNSSHTGIIPILSGISLFFIFNKINMKYNKFINTIATGAFATLMIHDHNFFRSVLWNEIIKVSDHYYDKTLYLLIYIVIVILAIYFISTLIELLRNWAFRIIYKSQLFIKTSRKIDTIVNGENESKNEII